MPFAVVETLNARGQKELSIVPDKWLRNSKTGSILLWPNGKSVAEQEKLLRDESSCPKKSWLKYACTVKRNPISSFAEGKHLLEELSGESSSDVSQLIRRKKKHAKKQSYEFQKMLVVESTPISLAAQAPAPSAPVIIEVSGSVGDHVLSQITSRPPPLSPLPPSPSPLSPSPPSPSPSSPPTPLPVPENSEDTVHTVQYEILPQTTLPPPAPRTVIEEISNNNVQTVEYVTYETLGKPDMLAEAENTTHRYLKEIIDQQQQITNRLDQMEKRTADIATQNEFILDAIRKLSSRTTIIEEPPSFNFDPIELEQELAELELKLADNGFKSKMVKWLRVNVSGDCADNRMLGVLDMLFSKQFQTECTWTGASRKGPKIAIMPNRNILQLFQQIGSDESEVVTQQKLAIFFKKKLKNSLKRLMTTGMRRGTRHVRRTKQQRMAVDQEAQIRSDTESDAGSIIIPSNVLQVKLNPPNEHSHSELESEDYTDEDDLLDA